MPKRTIEDVRSAGYTVALASGSVAVEEEALADARALAAPSAVQSDAEAVAAETARAAVAAGLADGALTEIVTRATRQALKQLQGARDDRVAFHERALAIAEASPDVWFVSALGDPDTPDDDVRVYVACKPDGTGWDQGAQDMIDLLVAPPPDDE